MKIGLIDADLIDGGTNFPNLALMKISGFYKGQGHITKLLLDYDDLSDYDKVFISKVFTKTYVADNILHLNNVEFGGTGFFYDKAPNLAPEIEHHMPDYNLYLEYVSNKVNNGAKRNKFTNYLDCSIGFTTRGCFRQCDYCVNRNDTKVYLHSPLDEFVDKNRRYIVLLDDNVLGSKDRVSIINNLIEMNKPVTFIQGMDIRLIDDKLTKLLLKLKYKGDYIFAFDNIEDKKIICDKMILWKRYIKRTTKLYCFCGFDRNDLYDENFERQDLIDVFERIRLMMIAKCNPYITRYQKYNDLTTRGTYINLARWCNQPAFYKKKSYREFCILNGLNSSSYKYLLEVENKYPDIANKYFDLKYEEQ